MPIPAQELASQIRFALDAEDSDHYNDDLDIIPAINASMRWVVNVINAAYGQQKIGEEIFRDLTYSNVFETSVYSRISLDVFPSQVWTILAVYPLPVTGQTGESPVTPGGDKFSILRPDLFHVSPTTDGAKRLTIEEWAFNRFNPFEAGYDGDAICDDIKEYAYLNPFNYSPLAGSSQILREIEIRPSLNRQLVSVFWVSKPSTLEQLTEDIPFPYEVFQLLFNKALQYIAYKQGDQTNLYSVSLNDIQMLISALQ